MKNALLLMKQEIISKFSFPQMSFGSVSVFFSYRVT